MEENWANVSLTPIQRRKFRNPSGPSRREIQGINLNTLLIGIFQLLGSPRLFDKDFPGGVYAWEELLDSVFVCLLQVCTMHEVLMRVFALFERCNMLLQKSSVSAASSSGNGTNADVSVVLQYVHMLCSGAVSFLFFWQAHGDSYFRDEDRLELLSFTVQLHDLVSQTRTKSQAQQAFLSRFTGKNKKDSNKSTTATAATEAVPTTLLNDKATERLSQLVTVLQSCVRGEEEQFSYYSLRNALNPELSQLAGDWTGGMREREQQEQKDRLKATFAAQPQVKLEIFGGAMLLDMSDEDEDEDSPVPVAGISHGLGNNNHSGNENNGMIVKAALQSRIAAGDSLLDESIFCSDRLQSMDAAELARQWTVADHAIFRSISLNSLLSPCFRVNESLQRSAGEGKIADSLRAGGCKRLVDRFNAASLWVSQSILEHTQRSDRAAAISFFLKLAMELQKLNNFHALMSILTALQQGAISRLRASFDLVPAADMQNFQKLKRLMAAGKNYAEYREELLQLIEHLPVDDKPCANWKKDVALRCAVNSESPRSKEVDQNMNAVLDNHEQGMDLGAESAVMPHLAAHSAALTYVTECHADFLSEDAHLFNTHKWRHVTVIMRQLELLQSRCYPLRPLRIVLKSLHVAWKVHFHRTAATAADAAKSLFALSEQRESAHDIDQYFYAKANPFAPPMQIHSSVSPNGTGHAHVRIARQNSDAASDAKRRDDGVRRQDPSKPRGLVRMLSTTFFGNNHSKQPNESESEEEDSENEEDSETSESDDHEKEEGEDEDGDEDEEEEESSEASSEESEEKTPKKRVLGIKRMLRAVSLLKKKE